jgi:sporulation integral membrane protein YlbJ
MCIDSALTGAKLFFNAVFPSLFPFIIIINIITAFNGISIYSKIFGKILCKPLRLPNPCSFVLIVSILCGYPLGAKYTCDLYDKKLIDIKTTQKLLNIASNASPLFVIGAIGTSMLGNTTLGYLLLISNYLSCFLMGLLIPSNITNTYIPLKKIKTSQNINIGKVLKGSVDDAVKSSMMIGGFIVIFSVIIGIIKNNAIFDIAISKLAFLNISKEIIMGSTLGLLEMTNGCHMICTSSIQLLSKLIILSFLISFSGFSIVSQVYSFTYKYPVSIKKYISLKLLQGILSSGITYILFTFLIKFTKITVLNTFTSSNLGISSIAYVILMLPLIFHICVVLLKRLFHIF